MPEQISLHIFNKEGCLESGNVKIVIVGYCMCTVWLKIVQIYVLTEYVIHFHTVFIFYYTEKNWGAWYRDDPEILCYFKTGLLGSANHTEECYTPMESVGSVYFICSLP